MRLSFNQNQIVKIETPEQYNVIKQYLRNPSAPSPDNWPIYLEWAESVSRGSTIGYTHSPESTWKREPVEVISFDEAMKGGE